MILASVIWGITGLLTLASLLPLSKLPWGSIRALDFPREQFCVIALVLAVVMPIAQPGRGGWIGAGLLLLVALVQLGYIVKFTPLWPRQSLAAGAELVTQQDRQVSLLAANVKQSNRAYDRLITLIQARQPDIVMTMEVDADWVAALRDGLEGLYPHWVEVPMDNSYGICLMSRLPLADCQRRSLVTEAVPSLRMRVQLRNETWFRLYVVHPEPPILIHDTKGRDSEIALVGMEAAKDPLPAVVAGDLNDVAWSTTTRRFQRLSGLLDPRVGRGFFNTFNALWPLVRWPLDHLFHDPQFRLIEMARLPKIGSDHFPMWFRLALADGAGEAAEIPPAPAEEKHEVKKMIAEEKRRPREAIGTDWEQE